jgi:hypothetical protein
MRNWFGDECYVVLDNRHLTGEFAYIEHDYSERDDKYKIHNFYCEDKVTFERVSDVVRKSKQISKAMIEEAGGKFEKHVRIINGDIKYN